MVSLTKELRKRMDSVKGQVNWSEVARNAFESKLAEIERTKGTNVDQELIDRLRKSKEEAENEDYQTGWNDGQVWAKDYADFRDLQRVERFCESNDNDYSWVHIYYVISDVDNRVDAREPLEFWEQHTGIMEPSDGMVKGFIEGALEVWQKVKEHL